MSPVKSPLKATPEDPLRILIVRADRIGDVVLSTPVISVIHRNYPEARLTLMVQAPVAPLVSGISGLDGTLIYDPRGRHQGLGGFWRLVQDLRAGRFRIVIALQTQWRLGLAILFSGIRYRVGPWSKLHSYLVYNRGVRQRRSEVEMHEADYNLQLLRKIGIRLGARPAETAIALSDSARAQARAWLLAQGWRAEAPLVVIHPGMGGSALNWPEAHYADLARRLLAQGAQVLLSAGPADRVAVERVHEGIVKAVSAEASAPAGLFVMDPVVERGIDFLGGLLELAQVVVAPSTGPLHVAVALGKRVVTVFPPIRVQSAIRWGPYLRDDARASVLHSEVYCGEDFHCRGAECHYFPCMKTVLPMQAFEEVIKHLRQSG
jgi:ADP-heptose:LPS heptosyltransferase